MQSICGKTGASAHEKIISLLIVLCLVLGAFASGTAYADKAEKPVAYFADDISPEGLAAIYEALNWEPDGPVAVKLSSGESPYSNYLRPERIADLVQLAGGTIVECNTACGGSRGAAAEPSCVSQCFCSTEKVPGTFRVLFASLGWNEKKSVSSSRKRPAGRRRPALFEDSEVVSGLC